MCDSMSVKVRSVHTVLEFHVKKKQVHGEILLFAHQSTSYIHSVNLHKYLFNEVYP